MKYRLQISGDKLLLLSLLVLFYAYSTYLRVAIRIALEGREFSWAYHAGVSTDGSAAIIRGEGLYGHASAVFVQALVLLWLLCAGLRKPDRFFQAALAGWTTVNFATGLWLAITFGDSLTVQKQTLGLSGLSYLWTNLLPEAVAWALAAALLVRGLLRPADLPPVRWTGLNSALLAASVLPLTLAAVLLNAGPQHGSADFNGIGMIYIAMLLFLAAMMPWAGAAGLSGNRRHFQRRRAA